MQKIKVLSTVKSVQEVIKAQKEQGAKIGFVPTMGALHDGHVSLVDQIKDRVDCVIVSIFVNPTQFNNPNDLIKYPRTINEDITTLEESGVDFVFIPSIEEIYPADLKSEKLDIGNLAKVMEGHFRPGHFDGVVQVVKRLFDIVTPDVACFGKKDFQQLSVIRFMTKYYQLPIEIVGCPIKREDTGLAMSSRNMRLSEQDKIDALFIYEVLQFAKSNTGNFSPEELKAVCILKFKETNLELEYLEIVSKTTLESLISDWEEGATCCIACYCGEVRLIDNMQLV